VGFLLRCTERLFRGLRLELGFFFSISVNSAWASFLFRLGLAIRVLDVLGIIRVRYWGSGVRCWWFGVWLFGLRIRCYKT
jgi:hypothetical protein